MHNQHKLYRVLRLINLLRSRPSKSIALLAELLETSERTIYRCLDMLSEVGFNIERTPHGKVQWEGEGIVEAFTFTADESLFLQRLVWTTGKEHVLRESFGIPILEGMACNTVLLTSMAASMPEVAGDAALLVDPKNVSEITQGIIKLASDPDLRSDLQARGLERAKEFSWRNTAVQVLSLYRQINQEAT